MSQLFIQQYLNQFAALRKVLGTTRESVLREAFKDLLKAWEIIKGAASIVPMKLIIPTCLQNLKRSCNRP